MPTMAEDGNKDQNVIAARPGMTQENGPVQVRTYQGRDQAKASQKFQEDANVLAASGYRPTSQIWVGVSKARMFLTPLILLVPGYLIGGIAGLVVAAVLGILYMGWSNEKAVGTLTVTYTRT